MEERIEMMKNVGVKVGQIILSYGKTIIAGFCLLIGLLLIGVAFIGDTVCYLVGLAGQKVANIFNVLMNVEDKYSEVNTK